MKPADPHRKETAKLERRAAFLAEKFNLSLQLTAIWVEKNPEASRSMLPSELKQLIAWARI